MAIELSDRSALVLFSGGQDSTTTLAWALDRYDHVETVGFDYGQRHAIELKARTIVAAGLRDCFPKWNSRLGADHLIDLQVLGRISETSLTSEITIAAANDSLPNTFVPGRNLIFLTFAAAIAYRRGIKHIVTGVCETDYSGYPDCRDDTIKAMQLALNLGMEARFLLHTPLMWLDKAETWAMAEALGGGELVNLIRDATHTCYTGDHETKHVWGYGCGGCPACQLRGNGWDRFKSVEGR